MGEIWGPADEAFRLQRERMWGVALGVTSPLAGPDAAVSAPTTVAGAIREMDMSAIADDMQFAINPSADLKVAAMLGEYKPAASLVQEFTHADYALNVNALTTSFLQHTGPPLDYPLGQYMSDVRAADVGLATPSWKPVLMRQSWLPETSFVASLPVAEHSLYSAIRPEILSVADQLGQTFQLPLQSMLVDYMGTPFELDLDFSIHPNYNLDVMPFADEPMEADSSGPRVIVREVIVWLDGKPLVLRITGTVIGEAAGFGVGLVADGAAGAALGGSVGAGLALALAEGLVIVVKRCRGRL